MTDAAMSPLRWRMIEDITIRKLAPKTQQGYIRTIKNLAAFLGRSLDKASFEDVRRFQLHVAERRRHGSTQCDRGCVAVLLQVRGHAQRLVQNFRLPRCVVQHELRTSSRRRGARTRINALRRSVSNVI